MKQGRFCLISIVVVVLSLYSYFGCSATVEDAQQLGAEQDEAGLLALLQQTNDSAVISEALFQLGELHSINAWNQIRSFLDDPLYHKIAAEALLKIQPEQHPELLLLLYLDSDSAIQKHVEQIVKAQLTTLESFLLTNRNHEHYRIRAWIASLVPLFHIDTKVDLLTQFVTDTNSLVRREAVISIGKLQDESTRSLLNQIKESDEDSDVRMEAARALDQLITIRGGKITDIRLAVLPFDNETGDDAFDVWSTQIANRISAVLSAEQVCYVVEQTEIQKALEQLTLQQSDFFDQATTSRIGSFMGTDQIIYGKILKHGLEFTLVAKRMNVETGEILNGAESTGYEADLSQLVQKLINDLLRGF
jgi:hypothetical protein